jgi:hypothetical protein
MVASSAGWSEIRVRLMVSRVGWRAVSHATRFWCTLAVNAWRKHRGDVRSAFNMWVDPGSWKSSIETTIMPLSPQLVTSNTFPESWIEGWDTSWPWLSRTYERIWVSLRLTVRYYPKPRSKQFDIIITLQEQPKSDILRARSYWSHVGARSPRFPEQQVLPR